MIIPYKVVNKILFLIIFCLLVFIWHLVCCSEILISFKNATHYAKDWAKAWHTWALFNTAVMSHYTLRGYSGIGGQYVVSAVTGYFYSIACASSAKGVDDSLQVRSPQRFLVCLSVIFWIVVDVFNTICHLGLLMNCLWTLKIYSWLSWESFCSLGSNF